MNEIDNHGSEIFPCRETVKGRRIFGSKKKSPGIAPPMAAPLLSIGAAGLITLAAVTGGLEASDPVLPGGYDAGGPPAIVEVQQPPVTAPPVTAPPIKKPTITPKPPTTPPPTTQPPETSPPGLPIEGPSTDTPAAPQTDPPADKPTDPPTDPPTEQPYTEPSITLPYTNYSSGLDPEDNYNILITVPFRIYLNMNSATSISFTPQLSITDLGTVVGSCSPASYTINPDEPGTAEIEGQAYFTVVVPPDGTPDPYRTEILDPAAKELTLIGSHSDGTNSGTVSVSSAVPLG